MSLGIRITGAILAVALLLVIVHLLAPLLIAAALGFVVLAWLKPSAVGGLASRRGRRAPFSNSRSATTPMRFALVVAALVIPASALIGIIGSPNATTAAGGDRPSPITASVPATESQSAMMGASRNDSPTPSPSPASTPTPTARPAAVTTNRPSPSAHTPTASQAATCRATDQDRFVYHPDRLEVLAPCLRVTGTVAAIRSEADGDLHILLALDAAYRHLLTSANQGVELGDLVVEPVCVHGVTQTDAVATCASNPDPLRSLPGLRAHVWMEGRYVLDLDHGGWAELHPLYRWGFVGGGPVLPSPTPAPPSPPTGTALSVAITGLSSPVAQGAYATASVRTTPSAYCTITVTYKSGTSSAAGLDPKTAPSSGALTWTWRVGTRTTPGSWPVTVRCAAGGSSASQTRYFAVS